MLTYKIKSIILISRSKRSKKQGGIKMRNLKEEVLNMNLGDVINWETYTITAVDYDLYKVETLEEVIEVETWQEVLEIVA